MRTSLLLTALLLVTGSELFAQTSTWPVGYRKETWVQNMNLFGLTLQRPTLVQGKISSSSHPTAGTTQVGGYGNFTALSSGNTYIFEVTSGTAKGTVQEFTTFTSTQVTLPVALTLSPEDDYQIRKAPTLEELFGTSTSILAKASSMVNADVVWIPAGAGTYSKYWIDSSTNTWRDVNGNPAPNVPVVYLDGLLIQRKAASPSLSYSVLGELKKGPTNFVVNEGTSSGSTPVSTFSPVGVTLQNFGVEDDIAPGFFGPTSADSVWIPNATSTYDGYYFDSGTSAWTNSSTGLAAAANLPLPSAVLIVRNGASLNVSATAAPSDQDYRFSPTVAASSTLSGSTYQAAFPVQLGKTYQPQTSTDGVTWSNLGSAVTPTGNSMTVTDSSATQNAKLYRLTSGAIRQGFDNTRLSRGTNSSSGLVPLGFTANFFGTSRTQLYVNTNGTLSFSDAFSGTPEVPLPSVQNAVIAPFWSYVDTTGYGGGEVYYGQGTVNGRNAFAAQWRNVAGNGVSNVGKKNSFQVVLIDRSDVAAGDFDFEFNYDSIQWDKGDSNPSLPSPGDFAARVGATGGLPYTIADAVELTGSGVQGSFLDLASPTTVNSSGLIYKTLNSTLPGRLSFQSRSGTINQTIDITDLTDSDPKITMASKVITLSASVTASTSSTVTWTQIDGPTANIQSPHSLSTQVTLPSGPGSYGFVITTTTNGNPSFQNSRYVAVYPHY